MAEPNLIMRASAEVPAPFAAAHLAAFIRSVPSQALIVVTTFTVGQRDPVPSKYIFTATWTTGDPS